MSISRDLFFAILSIDAYNRGYGAGIADGGANDPDGLGETSDGTVNIGNAVVLHNLEDAKIATEAQDAGFYAIAYQLADDRIVISYRGTNAESAGAMFDDVQHGWPLAVGNIGFDQAELAARSISRSRFRFQTASWTDFAYQATTAG